MKIQTWLKAATDKLSAAGIDTARLDSVIILESVLQKSREWILAHADDTISETKLKKLNEKITQRANRTPLAYIISSKEFYGHTFYVNNNVLIPRPESEAMIELLKDIIARQQINTIIDIGTGSGCLAISVKLLFPEIHVTAIDNSLKALSVARKNARIHSTQIQFKELDLFNGLPTMSKTRSYVILANLPYVPDDLITSEEIINEPSSAIFSGKNGLLHYQEFWHQVDITKNKPEAIITESLKSQHSQMIRFAQHHGFQLEKTDGLAQLFTKND